MPIEMDSPHDIQSASFNEIVDDSYFQSFGPTNDATVPLGKYGAMLQQPFGDSAYRANPPAFSLEDTFDDLQHIIEQGQEHLLDHSTPEYNDLEKPSKQEPVLPSTIQDYEWPEAIAVEQSMDLGPVIESSAMSASTSALSSPTAPISPPYQPHANRPANLPPLAVGGVGTDQAITTLGITEEQLASLKSADVEKTFGQFGKAALAGVKKRRRTIKNRKYAQSSRQRKKQRDTSGFGESSVLRQELEEKNGLIEELQKQIVELKSRVTCTCGSVSIKCSDVVNQQQVLPQPALNASLNQATVPTGESEWTGILIKEEDYDFGQGWLSNDSVLHQ